MSQRQQEGGAKGIPARAPAESRKSCLKGSSSRAGSKDAATGMDELSAVGAGSVRQGSPAGAPQLQPSSIGAVDPLPAGDMWFGPEGDDCMCATLPTLLADAVERSTSVSMPCMGWAGTSDLAGVCKRLCRNKARAYPPHHPLLLSRGRADSDDDIPEDPCASPPVRKYKGAPTPAAARPSIRSNIPAELTGGRDSVRSLRSSRVTPRLPGGPPAVAGASPVVPQPSGQLSTGGLHAVAHMLGWDCGEADVRDHAMPETALPVRPARPWTLR